MGIYRHWLETPMAIAEFRVKYEIPDDVQVRLDDPENPFDSLTFTNGWMPFPLVTVIEGGVRFPFSPSSEDLPEKMAPLPLPADAQWLQNYNGRCQAE